MNNSIEELLVLLGDTIADGVSVPLSGGRCVIERDGDVITVKRPSDEKRYRALHGLSRALLFNMVHGVTEGFQKVLEINGVGYRAQMQGKKLSLTLGLSHPVEMEETEDIKIEVPAPNVIIISGPDKQKVGQFAANVRAKRPPRPYKSANPSQSNKGIRYRGEVLQQKEGKTGAKK